MQQDKVHGPCALEQLFSTFNMHTDHCGILFKFRFSSLFCHPAFLTSSKLMPVEIATSKISAKIPRFPRCIYIFAEFPALVCELAYQLVSEEQNMVK